MKVTFLLSKKFAIIIAAIAMLSTSLYWHLPMRVVGPSLKLIRVSDGNVLHTWRVGEASVVFSGDGKTLVISHCSVGLGRKIDFWQLPECKRVRSITIGTSEDIILAVSRNGSVVAYGESEGNSVVILDVFLKKRTTVVTSRFNRLKGLMFSPDDKTIAIGGIYARQASTHRKIRIDSGVELWDLRKHLTKAFLATPGVFSLAMSFSSDGVLLAVGGEDQVYLWDVSRRNLINICKLKHNAETAVGFMQSGEPAIWNLTRDHMEIDSLSNGERIYDLNDNDVMPDANAAFSSSGRLIAVFDRFRTRLWKLPHCQRVLATKGASQIAISPSGRYIAIVSPESRM